MKLGLNELPLVTRAWHGDSIMCGFALACVKSVFGDVACLFILDFFALGSAGKPGDPFKSRCGSLAGRSHSAPYGGGQK